MTTRKAEEAEQTDFLNKIAALMSQEQLRPTTTGKMVWHILFEIDGHEN